jgi:hypothetical protein
MTVPSALLQCHLSKVYAKRDVTSRNQLGRVPPSRLSSAWLPWPPVFPRTRRQGRSGLA